MMPHALPPELERYVENEVASGKFRTADEVICEALRLLQARERRLDRLRADIDSAFDEIARGEVIDLPDESAQRKFFDALKEEIIGQGDST